MGTSIKPASQLSVTPRRAFLNSGYALLGTIVNGLATVLVVRYLGRADLGKYSVVLAFVPYFSVLANLGLDSILVREMARKPEHSDQLLANGIAVNQSLSAAAVVACWVVVRFFPYPSDVQFLIHIYSLSLLLGFSLLLNGVFQARLEMRYSALAAVLSRIVFVVLIVAIVLLKAGLPAFVLANLGWAAAQTLFLCFFLRDRIHLGLAADFQVWKYLVRESWPLALSSAFIAVYLRIDQLMLYWMMGAAPTGVYAASVRVAELFRFIPGAFMATVFPILSNRFATSAGSFEKIYQTSFRYLASVIVPIATWITLDAHRLLNLLYGRQFVVGAPALKILIWSEVFVFLGIVNQRVLVSRGLQKIDFIFTGVSAVVNVVLNIVLIPRFGIVGASLATLVSYGTGPFLGFLLKMTRDFSLSMSRGLARPLIAASCVVLASRIDHRASLGLSALQTFVVYSVMLAILGGITKEDKDVALRILFGD